MGLWGGSGKIQKLLEILFVYSPLLILTLTLLTRRDECAVLIQKFQVEVKIRLEIESSAWKHKTPTATAFQLDAFNFFQA